MGFYIDKLADGTPLSAKDKYGQLIQIPGAKGIKAPVKWEKDLVCCVDNGTFEAAGFVYNEKEMRDFLRPDGRPRRWLTIPNAGDLTYFGKLSERDREELVGEG